MLARPLKKLEAVAEAFYEVEGSQATITAFQFQPEDLATAGVDVWPDNVQSYYVFQAMSRQWRTGMGGPIGLDFGVLNEVWLRVKVPEADRDGIFSDLQVMENAALKQISENNAS